MLGALRQIVARYCCLSSVAVAACSFVLVSSVIGCDNAMADEYYRVFSNSAIYIAWTETGTGNISGQVQTLTIDPNDPTKLKSANAAFTGILNGRNISISFGLFSSFSGQTWTGTIGWNSLTLVFPNNGGGASQQTLYAGSFQDYAAATQQLGQAVARAQQNANLAAQVRDAAQHVKDAAGAVASALSALAQTFPTQLGNDSLESDYARDWAQMQSDWQKEQSEAAVTPMTCYQKSQVQYDASQVKYDLSQVSYVDSQVRYVSDSANRSFSTITDALAELSTWASVYDQRSVAYAQAAGGGVNPSVAQKVPQFAARVNDRKAYYKHRLATIFSIARGYDDEAASLNEKAHEFADALSCSQ